MGRPNTGRAPVSDSCTQEGGLTVHKPTHLREDREGGLGLPWRKIFFEGLSSWKEKVITSRSIVFSSLTIRRLFGGLKWTSGECSEILSPNKTVVSSCKLFLSSCSAG